MPRSQRSDAQRASAAAVPETPRLSPERAFVVQLERAPAPRRRTFRGRVEHLSTGEARHFGSLADLLDFINRFA